MTAFGYHTAAMVPQVLLELKPSNGEIAQHQPGVGAWVHVRFGEWRQMHEALAKNGRVLQGCMLGVIEGVVPRLGLGLALGLGLG